MHVKSFTSQAPSLLDDWTLRSRSPEMILVALVSRAMDSPTDYHTEVKLFNKSDFEGLDVSILFWRFFKHIKNSAHSLTVLRSGYLVDASSKKKRRMPYSGEKRHSQSLQQDSASREFHLRHAERRQVVEGLCCWPKGYTSSQQAQLPATDPNKGSLGDPPGPSNNPKVAPPEVEVFGHI